MVQLIQSSDAVLLALKFCWQALAPVGESGVNVGARRCAVGHER